MIKKMTLGLLLCGIMAVSFALESDGIFKYSLGQFEIYMLVESEREGNTAIIPGADEETLMRYIPTEGFRHTANAFLIKTPEHNALVDTGTGSGGVILEKIKKLGMEPEEIDAVFITHLHWDHFGGLGSDGKANFPNAVVFISEREFDHFTRIAVNQRVLDALEPYGSNIITFEPCILGSTYRELVPGLTAIANYGHTPGHTVFLVENSGAKLVIAGDFLHVALVQFPNPDISATFDMDQDAAAASRRQILNYAARNRIPVGGIHIVYPGIGNVEADGNGFRFIPVVSATLNN